MYTHMNNDAFGTTYENGMKIERGVLVMRHGKAWGVAYKDGHCTDYGWVEPADAELHDPKYCRWPTDVTYQSSPYLDELATGTLVSVTRRTTVTVNP